MGDIKFYNIFLQFFIYIKKTNIPVDMNTFFSPMPESVDLQNP